MTQSKTSNLLAHILQGKTLKRNDIQNLFRAVESSGEGAYLLEAYLLTLKVRGISTQEFMEFAGLLLKRARKLKAKQAFLDVCGTGGDKSDTFNISTISGLVIAAAGVPVLKHGNRSVSSQCGSSDLLESFGVDLTKASKRAEGNLDKLNFAYLHAPFFHPFLGKVAPIRKKIGEPTLFNYLGPLLHPASPAVQLTGVSDEGAFRSYPKWIQKLGRKRAFVLRGEGGLDEATPFGVTELYDVSSSRIRRVAIRAKDFGFKARSLKELVAKTPGDNKRICRQILSGKERGAKREAILLNSGLGFLVFGTVKNLKDGIELSDIILKSGIAMELLTKFTEATQ